jgi:O-acetyl-ADP-ribose deacetylase (regulator of RNase III)
MMVRYVRGNLLDAQADALVNTVNTVGVMGKGIALQFKKAFPDNFKAYARAVKHGEVQLGKMFVYERSELLGPRFIINFPTKGHWKSGSNLEDIKTGLVDLVNVIRKFRIHSVAVPALGSGSGGLEWNMVKKEIEQGLSNLQGVSVVVYPPQDAPLPEAMKVASTRPNWTASRAALIGVLEKYCVPGYRLSMLEIQKLVYFLQVVGEPMKLQFVKGKYGPYAENLHHLLQRLDGHFIRGYGDRSRGASIHLVPDAVAEAKEILKDNRETQTRLESVSKFIEGFETPYGLELLSSVHWLSQENDRGKSEPEEMVRGVHAWNERKRKTFKPEHIQVAWRRLQNHNWLESHATT